MRQHPAASPRLALLIAFALSAAGAIPPSSAATIFVPPVTVTQLLHETGVGFARDYIVIPGTGYTSSGFAATIATGDVVVVRIQAPPGKKFVVHAPAVHPPALPAPGDFSINMYWLAASGTLSLEDPHTLTFENLLGTPPVVTYSLVGLGDQRQTVEVLKDCQFSSAFEFTAIQVTITASRPLPTVTQVYSDVRSYSAPSFWASGDSVTPQLPIMEIVDIAVPTQRTSWGTLKALYR